MYICKDDVVKILEVMETFPDAKTFELEQDGGNGIGTVTSLIIHTVVNGMDGEFKVEISGVENW